MLLTFFLTSTGNNNTLLSTPKYICYIFIDKNPLNLSEPTCIMQDNRWMVQMPNKITKAWIEKLQNKCKNQYLAPFSLERQHYHQHERKNAFFSVETDNKRISSGSSTFKLHACLQLAMGNHSIVRARQRHFKVNYTFLSVNGYKKYICNSLGHCFFCWSCSKILATFALNAINFTQIT